MFPRASTSLRLGCQVDSTRTQRAAIGGVTSFRRFALAGVEHVTAQAVHQPAPLAEQGELTPPAGGRTRQLAETARSSSSATDTQATAASFAAPLVPKPSAKSENSQYTRRKFRAKCMQGKELATQLAAPQRGRPTMEKSVVETKSTMQPNANNQRRAVKQEEIILKATAVLSRACLSEKPILLELCVARDVYLALFSPPRITGVEAEGNIKLTTDSQALQQVLAKDRAQLLVKVLRFHGQLLEARSDSHPSEYLQSLGPLLPELAHLDDASNEVFSPMDAAKLVNGLLDVAMLHGHATVVAIATAFITQLPHKISVSEAVNLVKRALAAVRVEREFSDAAGFLRLLGSLHQRDPSGTDVADFLERILRRTKGPRKGRFKNLRAVPGPAVQQIHRFIRTCPFPHGTHTLGSDLAFAYESTGSYNEIISLWRELEAGKTGALRFEQSFPNIVISAVGRQRRCIPADLDLADAIWTQALAEGFPFTSKTYEARAVCLRLSERWHDLLALLIDEFPKRLQGARMLSKDLLWQVAVWYTVPSPKGVPAGRSMMPEWVRGRLEEAFPGKMPVRSTQTSEEKKVERKPMTVEVEEGGELVEEEEWEDVKEVEEARRDIR